MMSGWLKLWRELIKKPIWKRSTPEQCKILITLLTMANYESNEWEWGCKKFSVEPGQFVTSLKSIQQECGKGVSIKIIRTALLRFEKLGFLASEGTKHGRLITILNWDTYQGDTPDNGKGKGKARAKGGQSTGKARAPIKEGKKDNNDNKKESPDETSSSFLLNSRYTESQKGKIREVFESFARTRDRGKVADSILLAELKWWEQYEVGRVIDSIVLYIDRNFSAEKSKDEKYLRGIIRRSEYTPPEQLGRKSGRASGKKRPAAEMFGKGISDDQT